MLLLWKMSSISTVTMAPTCEEKEKRVWSNSLISLSVSSTMWFNVSLALPGWLWAASWAGYDTTEGWTTGVQRWWLPRRYWPGNLPSYETVPYELPRRTCTRSQRTHPNRKKIYSRALQSGFWSYESSAPLTHHNAVGHEEHQPTEDMDHEEGHWQTTQVIILTAAEDIPMTCITTKSHFKRQDINSIVSNISFSI